MLGPVRECGGVQSSRTHIFIVGLVIFISCGCHSQHTDKLRRHRSDSSPLILRPSASSIDSEVDLLRRGVFSGGKNVGDAPAVTLRHGQHGFLKVHEVRDQHAMYQFDAVEASRSPGVSAPAPAPTPAVTSPVSLPVVSPGVSLPARVPDVRHELGGDGSELLAHLSASAPVPAHALSLELEHRNDVILRRRSLAQQ